MVFYVYLDPEVIGVAQQEGKYAIQSLLAIIKDFTQNCFLAEYEDYRIQPAIREYADNFPDGWDRIELKKLIGKLIKHNRFIYCLLPDQTNTKADKSLLFEQASDSLIDLILLSNLNGIPDLNRKITVTDLSNYQMTNFASERSALASNGRQFQGGELGEYEFLDHNYKKAFMYAKRLEICDAIFGRKFKDNFRYSLGLLLRWLNSTIKNISEFKFILHCGLPSGRTPEFIRQILESFKTDRLSDVVFEIYYYQEIDNNQCLPHERYLITDQIAFQIGRGMDFIDKNTRRNRDTSIDLKDPTSIEKIIQHYKNFIVDEVIIL